MVRTSPSSTEQPDWVVCFGATRTVKGGRVVHCPVGGFTQLRDCLACRRLETHAAERNPAAGCDASLAPMRPQFSRHRA